MFDGEFPLGPIYLNDGVTKAVLAKGGDEFGGVVGGGGGRGMCRGD